MHLLLRHGCLGHAIDICVCQLYRNNSLRQLLNHKYIFNLNYGNENTDIIIISKKTYAHVVYI